MINKTKEMYSTYYQPGSALRTLHVLTHLIHITTLRLGHLGYSRWHSPWPNEFEARLLGSRVCASNYYASLLQRKDNTPKEYLVLYNQRV